MHIVTMIFTFLPLVSACTGARMHAKSRLCPDAHGKRAAQEQPRSPTFSKCAYSSGCWCMRRCRCRQRRALPPFRSPQCEFARKKKKIDIIWGRFQLKSQKFKVGSSNIWDKIFLGYVPIDFRQKSFLSMKCFYSSLCEHLSWTPY